MPGASDDILKQLHAPVCEDRPLKHGSMCRNSCMELARCCDAQLRRISHEFSLDLLPGHTIATPEYLFASIEDKEADRLRKLYGGNQDAASNAAAPAKPAAATATSAPAKGKTDKKDKSKPQPQPAAATQSNPQPQPAAASQ